MRASALLPILALCFLLQACGGTPAPTASVPAEKPPAPEPPKRVLLSADGDIHVDAIAVQYGDGWSYVGNMAFSMTGGEPRLPDPATEDFIVVVREALKPGTKVPGLADLKPGTAYQWLGKSDFHVIRTVDLALSDGEIAKLFGVGTPSTEEKLVKLLDSRKIDTAAVQKLLDTVRRINYRNPVGISMLHRAAYWGHLDIVKALVAKGADVNLAGMNDDSPVASAAAGGNPDIVDFLISKGVDVHRPNIFGDTPLHYTVYNSTCVECAKLLIAHGADPDAKNSDGLTPLDLAKHQQKAFGFNNNAIIAYLSSLKGP